MTNFKKFTLAANSYLVIDKEESINVSNVSCNDMGSEIATIEDLDINFVKEKFFDSKLDTIKFYIQINTINTSKCYTLLVRSFLTVECRY